ncbi:MAG: hypothetical protein ACK41C_11860 [Phenylobacterium sp.]|uniref:hypothetical protein n=1 Tax=Phenylobacterium sp. TaxID=1871053 RepID=UPI00391C3D09
MNLKIVMAGAASALLVGSFAVAQTYGQTGTAQQDTTAQTMDNQATDNRAADSRAMGAEGYATDTAAQGYAQAGERG